MKNYLSLFAFLCCFFSNALSQNTGIGTSTPLEKLDVNGGIRMGNSTNNNAGTMRYAAGSFEGNDGTGWKAFTQLPAGTLVGSANNPNTALQNAGFSFYTTLYTSQSAVISTVVNSWLPTNLLGAPKTTLSAAIYTGSKVIIWGGFYEDYLATGSLYDPATDSFTQMAASPLSARYGASIVWTGTVAIIWGGYGVGGQKSDGASYNPATDTWQMISSTGAPSARENHTAIYTGSEMIIWGGNTGSGKTATGSRYDPATNTWTALPAAPISERNYHSAIWSGTQMIIWGGADNTGIYKNDGAMYNRATNSWTATSLTGSVPAARYTHSTVWTGTEMIIWGGSNTSGFLNTGGRFNPATNSWGVATTTTGAPALRSSHTAVWTGSRMIIWGGLGPGASSYIYYNNGASYNPASNVWSGLPTSGAPVERSSHKALWTGNQMVILGGSNSIDGTFGAGGRYIVNSESNITSAVQSAIHMFIKN